MRSLMISSLLNHCWVRGWKFFLKIGQHLPKLWANKYQFAFMKHGVCVWPVLGTIRFHSQYHLIMVSYSSNTQIIMDSQKMQKTADRYRALTDFSKILTIEIIISTLSSCLKFTIVTEHLFSTISYCTLWRCVCMQQISLEYFNSDMNWLAA